MKKIEQFIESRFKSNIQAHVRQTRLDGNFDKFPNNLDLKLKGILEDTGIDKLYTHQKEAFDSISSNEDTLLVSHTASGKTLSFFLPILDEYIKSESSFSVLLLYPTKALSRDQESTFSKLMKAVKKNNTLGTFDGDTPRDERARIQRSVDFIITNPDMLHSGILPNHNRKWKSFLSRLRYIVVDEVHTYRGSFGSHVSNVFRRLTRVCGIHGSLPVYVCSSATIGNPGEHVEALFHRKFNVIDKDSSPRPGRDLYFINPSLVKSHGDTLYRKGTSSVSIPLIREAAKRGVRTICFCRSRQEVERLYRAVTDGNNELKSVVKPYRGGLLPNERRKLERDLVSGRITAVISTNALELGIDIGDLQLCILSGHPGTIASFWQQSGRVGRKDKDSIVVYIAKDKPIDQYLVHHSEFYTSAPVEQAWLNADNPYIVLQHLPCMAHEHPLREFEDSYDTYIYKQAVNILKDNKTIVPYHDTYRYALQDYPARGVNLRGMTDYNVEIYSGTEVIGELDPIGARGTLYKDAIYQHLGRRYMSMDLDLDKKLCRVTPVDVDYYTEAVWEGRIQMIELEEEKQLNESVVKFGEINVNKQPKLYKKIRERSYENIGYGPITLPAFEYDTTGFSLLPSKKWVDFIGKEDKRYIGAALYGISYLLRHTAPSICMADVKDIDTDVSLVETDNQQWKSSLYLFDTIRGGVGYAEKIYEKIEECLNLAADIIEKCECKYGCPSCVPPLPPGVANEELEDLLIETNASSECAKSLLQVLKSGCIYRPKIKHFKITSKGIRPAHYEDEEKKKIDKKLNRAARLIKRNRERQH